MDIIAVAESLGMDLKQESGGIYHWLEHDSFKLYPKLIALDGGLGRYLVTL